MRKFVTTRGYGPDAQRRKLTETLDRGRPQGGGREPEVAGEDSGVDTCDAGEDSSLDSSSKGSVLPSRDYGDDLESSATIDAKKSRGKIWSSTCRHFSAGCEPEAPETCLLPLLSNSKVSLYSSRTEYTNRKYTKKNESSAPSLYCLQKNKEHPKAPAAGSRQTPRGLVNLPPPSLIPVKNSCSPPPSHHLSCRSLLRGRSKSITGSSHGDLFLLARNPSSSSSSSSSLSLSLSSSSPLQNGHDHHHHHYLRHHHHQHCQVNPWSKRHGTFHSNLTLPKKFLPHDDVKNAASKRKWRSSECLARCARSKLPEIVREQFKGKPTSASISRIQAEYLGADGLPETLEDFFLLTKLLKRFGNSDPPDKILSLDEFKAKRFLCKRAIRNFTINVKNAVLNYECRTFVDSCRLSCCLSYADLVASSCLLLDYLSLPAARSELTAKVSSVGLAFCRTIILANSSLGKHSSEKSCKIFFDSTDRLIRNLEDLVLHVDNLRQNSVSRKF